MILELINTAWLLKNTYCSNRITSQRDGSRACNHDASSSGFPLAPQMSPAQPVAPPPSPSWLRWPVSGDRTPSTPCKSKAQSPGSSRNLRVTPGVKGPCLPPPPGPASPGSSRWTSLSHFAGPDALRVTRCPHTGCFFVWSEKQ